MANGERARPKEHCAINFALYHRDRPRAVHWVFSEYPERLVSGRLAPELRVGRNVLSIDRTGYDLCIDDHEPWHRRRVRGHIRFDAIDRFARAMPIDQHAAHRWLPAAPRVRFHATFANPALQFEGSGYHDVNHGDAPLATAFSRWTWGRAQHGTRTSIGYDRLERDGTRSVLSLDIDSTRAPRVRDRLEPSALLRRRGAWTLREPSSVLIGDERVAMPRRCEGSPFYARYAGREPSGRRIVAEHLDLDRFEQPVMQQLLPFRARRVP